MNKILIAPSILAADYASLKSEIEKVKNAGADMLHVDVMDGHFAFKKAGADMISFHLESDSDPDEVIEKIIQCGIKPAVVIKPQTAASAVFPYLKKVFAVLVMTVEPGFGGQSFMTDTVKKIKEIRDEAERLSIPLHIEVDGGIDKNTAPVAKEAGADMLVAGSYIFNSDDVVSAVASLR